jgi:hypothetical protein
MTNRHHNLPSSLADQGLSFDQQRMSGTEDDDDGRDDEDGRENEAPVRETDEDTEAPEEFEAGDARELTRAELEVADEAENEGD